MNAFVIVETVCDDPVSGGDSAHGRIHQNHAPIVRESVVAPVLGACGAQHPIGTPVNSTQWDVAINHLHWGFYCLRFHLLFLFLFC